MDWGELGRKALKAAKSGWDAGVEWTQKMQALKSQYQSKSDEELEEIIKDHGFFGPSEDERRAAMMVWKERHGG
jgi:hypothetical protein